jgi:phosphoribosyl 1,2-cyclic phosphodiesterase
MPNAAPPSFLFLGTGAADWVKPEPSGEFRAFSSMLASGNLLFDCPAHVPETLAKYGVPFSSINYIFITHSHADHFDENAVKLICASGNLGTPAIVYASAAVAETLRNAGVDARDIEPGKAFNAGEYSVIPLAANHSTTGLKGEISLHYLVNYNGCRWFYATDGAWILCASWNILREWQLDALIIDATIGEGHEGDCRVFEHNSLPMIRIMVETLKKNRVLKPSAPVILTHLARTLHPDQQALEKNTEPPFVVAYDGMRYEF